MKKMVTGKSKHLILPVIILILFTTSCSNTPDPTSPPLTPTQCSGWNCSLQGVVYKDSSYPGNELAGITVQLEQISNCSPTRGEVQTITAADGSFVYNVYLHDTDTLWVEINLDGFEPVRQAIGGFDCLYCNCSPIEIILQAVE